MGNERSHLAGLEVDDDAIEVTEAWSMYSATFNNEHGSKLSVFISPMFPGIAKTNTPSLVQAAKNLMLHRHPCILKFVSSWSHGGRFHLATEEVQPLSHFLEQQTALQICMGLHSVLNALIFLHDKARASHNNVCCSAIYVSPDGTWKLGGFEFLCLFKDLSSAHLQQSRAHRYEKAVPPEEDGGALTYPAAIDQYAFGVLVEEVLKKKSEGEEELNSLVDFRELARRQLQSSEPSLRPPLASLLQHTFFDHNFLHIHSFLIELPLKTESERQNFFRSLPGQLIKFPEEVVAAQLASLLLSRLVLLDKTAQEHLLPALLHPKTGIDDEETATKGIFSMLVFKQHVVPRLLQMLCVRDAQIRLLLLSHFHCFLPAFSSDQLRTSVLPELLVGIKDTNDTLVSMTLRALADLVPVLGAAVVIGGKRGKIFTDGRPKVNRSPIKEFKKKEKLTSQSKAVPSPVVQVNGNTVPQFSSDLPERPSPDGGEAEVATSDKAEEEVWSDWDVSELQQTGIEVDVDTTENQGDESATFTSNNTEAVGNAGVPTPSNLPDITTLDIKNLSSPVKGDDIDFFQDMEPIISKPPIFQVDQLISDQISPSSSKGQGSLFDVALASVEGDAWGEDIGDWGLDDTSEGMNRKSNS